MSSPVIAVANGGGGGGGAGNNAPGNTGSTGNNPGTNLSGWPGRSSVVGFNAGVGGTGQAPENSGGVPVQTAGQAGALLIFENTGT